MSEREKLNWDIDTRIGLIINEVAKKHNIDTSVVRKVITIYYKNISVAMESNMFPKINIKGMGILRPVPKFIKARIDSMIKKGSAESETIQNLEKIFKRESKARSNQKRNKSYKKYEQSKQEMD